jgi:hypothetical protein
MAGPFAGACNAELLSAWPPLLRVISRNRDVVDADNRME